MNDLINKLIFKYYGGYSKRMARLTKAASHPQRTVTYEVNPNPNPNPNLNALTRTPNP